MTNAQIIFQQSQALAEQGIIKYTGREFTFDGEDGEQFTIKETEPIHTYNAWKALGFQVQKGQKAVAQFTIWKYKAQKNEETDEEEKGKMFMKRASFFTAEQVEKIAQRMTLS